MTRHDFIFSDKRRHRVARHVVFWFVWCLAFNLLFHFPIHVFKGWDTNGPGTKNLQELGLPLFFIKTLVVNSFFGVVIPQILFTYVLLYWFLPHYFLKKRNLILTTGIISCVLLIFFFVATGFKYSPVIYNLITGMNTNIPDINSIKRIVIIDQLTTLPIVAGFALLIKLIKRWWVKQREAEQITKEKINAELQLLKAQVHPHFLFNTLNNIYFFTLTNSVQAPIMIKKLSGMLHYILNECNDPLVPLDKEIKMIRDYMALEKIRYGEQFQMTIEMPDNNSEVMIAPLLLIPFVENSFKHGVSKIITHPWVKLRITIENNRLQFIIVNSRPTTTDTTSSKGNIGLKNVKKRLELLYPGTHELNIASEANNFTVYLDIDLENSNKTLPAINEIKLSGDYAVA